MRAAEGEGAAADLGQGDLVTAERVSEAPGERAREVVCAHRQDVGDAAAARVIHYARAAQAIDGLVKACQIEGTRGDADTALARAAGQGFGSAQPKCAAIDNGGPSIGVAPGQRQDAGAVLGQPGGAANGRADGLVETSRVNQATRQSQHITAEGVTTGPKRQRIGTDSRAQGHSPTRSCENGSIRSRVVPDNAERSLSGRAPMGIARVPRATPAGTGFVPGPVQGDPSQADCQGGPKAAGRAVGVGDDDLVSPGVAGLHSGDGEVGAL